MRQGRHIDPAIVTAPIHRLARPHQGVTVDTLPVTPANVVLATVLITRDKPAHTVVGVPDGIGVVDKREDNGMNLWIKFDVVERVVSDCMGH